MAQIEDKQSIPWERRKYMGWFKALRRTTKEILFHPGRFFKKLVGIDSCQDAFIFYLIINLVGGLLAAAVLLVSNLPFIKVITPLLPFLLFAPILVFLFLCIAIFVISALMHLFVFLFKGEGGFSGTFNVISYSAVIAVVWSLLLFAAAAIINVLISSLSAFSGIVENIGLVFSFTLLVVLIVVGLLWNMIIAIIGYKRIHNLSSFKAACSFLLPLIALIAVLQASSVPVREANPLENLIQAQLRDHETGAKLNCMIIHTACQNYFAYQKRYPSSLKGLATSPTSYISKDLSLATHPSVSIKKYYYVYESINPGEFSLYAKPIDSEQVKSSVFFIDQTGVLRVAGFNGLPLRDLIEGSHLP